MTDKKQTEALKKKVVQKMTNSAMSRIEKEEVLRVLRRAELIHPECKEIALKLIALCTAEDERTPPEYADRKYEWEGRSPFLLADGSPKPEVVEWAKQLYALDSEIGMFSIVECIHLYDLRQLQTAFAGIGGWALPTATWPPSNGRSA